MKISSKQITNSIIWNKNNNNKQNKQPSLPVARPALSSSSPSRIFYYDSQSMNILFLLVVDYCYIVFTYWVSYLHGIFVKMISRKNIEIFVKMISRKKVRSYSRSFKISPSILNTLWICLWFLSGTTKTKQTQFYFSGSAAVVYDDKMIYKLQISFFWKI